MLVPVYLKHVYTIRALLLVCMIAWNIEPPPLPPPPSQSPVRSPSCHPLNRPGHGQGISSSRLQTHLLWWRGLSVNIDSVLPLFLLEMIRRRQRSGTGTCMNTSSEFEQRANSCSVRLACTDWLTHGLVVDYLNLTTIKYRWKWLKKHKYHTAV